MLVEIGRSEGAEMKTIELTEEQIALILGMIEHIEYYQNVHSKTNLMLREIDAVLNNAKISLCMNPQINFGCDKCERRSDANKEYSDRTWIKPDIVLHGMGPDDCMDFILAEK